MTNAPKVKKDGPSTVAAAGIARKARVGNGGRVARRKAAHTVAPMPKCAAPFAVSGDDGRQNKATARLVHLMKHNPNDRQGLKKARKLAGRAAY